jgi:hypothetical protein
LLATARANAEVQQTDRRDETETTVAAPVNTRTTSAARTARTAPTIRRSTTASVPVISPSYEV